MAKNKPQANEGLDSLLGELDAMAAPSEAPVDDLDSLLDEIGDHDVDVMAEPGAADLEPSLPAPRAKPSHRRLALIAAGLVLSHGALFGFGYWLGGHKAPHGETPSHSGEAAPLEGVLRYVGHPADLRVDGHLIFTSPEVRERVLELSGGQSLADALEKFSRRVKSLGPVTRDGDLIEVKACNPAACGAEAFSLRYNHHTHQVWVCQTVPYAGGASLSYLYGEEGMEEVARCVDAGPQPVAALPPAEEPPVAAHELAPEADAGPAREERQLARPGRAPPQADHAPTKAEHAPTTSGHAAVD